MNVEHFLDTNIFVYMLDETDDLKRRRAEQLVRCGLSRAQCRSSYFFASPSTRTVTMSVSWYCW